MNSSFLLGLGLTLTALFTVFCVWLGLQEVCILNKDGLQVCKSNFKVFIDSPPNEKGDTLAGVAGSLAFLWIIVTVLLQANELSLQRQELKQTRQSLQTQTGFLEAQNNDRLSLSVNKQIETKIETLSLLIKKPDFEALDGIGIEDNVLRRRYIQWITNKKRRLDLSSEEFADELKALVKNIRLKRDTGIYIVKPDSKNWEEIRTVAGEILDLSEHATPEMRDRITRIERIDELHEALSSALAEELWAKPDTDHQS